MSVNLSTNSPHVRIAVVCTHKECLPPFRRFLFSEKETVWGCPDHGKTHVRRQVNRPYVKPVV